VALLKRLAEAAGRSTLEGGEPPAHPSPDAGRP
jgi:hypothetical protein